MKKNLVRPVLINAAIVLLLLLADIFFNEPSSRFFVSGTVILLLAALNFIVGMIRNRNRKGDGPYYFLLAGILLLIGFSVCSVSLG